MHYQDTVSGEESSFLHHFKTTLGLTSLQEHPEISISHLLVAGGAQIEANEIKNALKLFNYAQCDIQYFMNNADDSYLYQQLHNKVVIVDSGGSRKSMRGW